jgi:hypothetical protein
MKTRLLILTAIISFLVIPQAFGIPFFSEEQKIAGGQFIAIGKITSYHDEGIYRFYEVKIIEWLKNPLDQETVSFRSINEKGFDSFAPKTIFEVDDYAIINLRDYDRGFLESTFFSYKISEDQIKPEAKKIKEIVALNNNPLVVLGILQANDESAKIIVVLNYFLLFSGVGVAVAVSVFVIRRKRK